MALRQIRKDGDEILHKKAKPVKEINQSIITLIDDMIETLRDKNALGLAAPQIGVLKRIVVIEHEDEVFEMINPEIIETEGEQISNEACLSIPGLCGDVKRPIKVKVRAQDRNGDFMELEGEQIMASVFSHELDHLDGILYTQNATNVKHITEEELIQRKARSNKE